MRADCRPRQWSRRVAPALVGLLVLAGCANVVGDIPPTVRHGEAATRFVYSPYKHVPIALDPTTRALSTAVRGTPTPIVIDGRSTLPPGVTALTLAFATGECGTETWDGMDPQVWADANLRAFGRAGIDYVISTGGEGGVFTCATDAGMEAFVAHYMSPHLVGFDFDIEHAQSDDVVASLVQRIATAQRKHPKLRFSFTLATWAANDGSLASLNADGERVMRAIREVRFDDFYINLMVMDYGEARPGNCVVAAGVCDMGQSAIQAARNLNARHSVPFHRIELTPMLGVNDVAANVFSLDDARTLARFVRDNGLAGVHFWSLDRDTACPPGVSGVSSMCNGLRGVAALGFTAAIRDELR